MASIETYKRAIGAKVLKRLMVGKPVDDEDIRDAVADPHYGLIVVKTLKAEKPKDVDEWDSLIKRILSYELDGRPKYEALAAIDPNLDVHAEVKDRWGQPFTLVDAYEDRPPLEYVVKGVFPQGSLSIVYGAPGSMKSLIAAQLVIDIVCGHPWLDHPAGATPGFGTNPNACMWLDFDNGKIRTHERFKAFGKARDVPPDAPLFYYSMAWPVLDASEPIQIGELIGRVKAHNVRMLVIDNLGVISGGRDENTSQMQEVITGLRRVADDTGTAVVVLHHSRKSSGFNNARSGDAMRGHSSIEAGLDLALLVTRDDQSDLIALKATKVRGAPIKPFSAQFSYEHQPGTDELGTCCFWGIEVEDTSSDKVIQKAILDVVRVGSIMGGVPLNKSQVTEQVKNALPETGQNKILTNIAALVASGQVVVNKGEKNASLLTLPADSFTSSGGDDDD